MKSFIPVLLFCLFFTYSSASPEEVNQVEGAYKKFEFINHTGREVNDLHIIFDVPVEIDRNNTKFDESGVFQKGEATNAQGQTITSFDKFKLANNQKATIWVSSESADIQIKKWWWTFDGQRVGPERNGTLNDQGQRDLTNQDRDLVGHDEEVSGYKFKNPVPKPTKNREFGVNDLHLITLKKPVVVNAEKKNEQEPAKIGGKFPEDQTSVTECDCTQRYNSRTERTCYELCKMEAYQGKNPVYIVNLKADEVIPYDSTVIVKLKGKGEVKIEAYFWTRDGKPIDFDASGNGRIKKENAHDGSLPKKPLNGNAQGKPEHLEEISYQLFNPFHPARTLVSRPEYGIGGSIGIFSGPPATTFNPDDMAMVQQIFFDPAFMELVQKQIIPDEFSGYPNFFQDQYSLIMSAELYGYYRLHRAMQISGFARLTQQTREARFAYLFNDLFTDALFTGEGLIKTEIRSLSIGAGLDYFPWQSTRWEPFIGLRAGYQLPLSVPTEIRLEGHTFPLEKTKPGGHALGGSHLGLQYRLPKGYAIGLTVGLEYHLGGADNNFYTGAGLRISKGF